MQTYRIRSTEDRHYAAMWELYCSSFPLCEQRTPDHQQTALRCENYHLELYFEGDILIGLNGYWEFETYLYIEHYAINPALRGGGWGSRILSHLQRQNTKTIILEIDEVKDEVSQRRLRFYDHLGFVVNPYPHPLPRYRTDSSEHRADQLTVLSYPAPLSAEQYARFRSELETVVMRRA